MRISSSARVLFILSAAVLLATGSTADTVYRSIDKDGRTSYSNTPPDNHQQSVKINILPPPSQDSVKAAEQRHQQNLNTEKSYEDSRKIREQDRAEKNRIKREKQQRAADQQPPEEPKQEGPYYGIPGHGILVLPGGPRINP